MHPVPNRDDTKGPAPERGAEPVESERRRRRQRDAIGQPCATLCFASLDASLYRAKSVRNVVYRFERLDEFARSLRGSDQELMMPTGERVDDGEWVLAIFEIGGARGRATAAAARGVVRDDERVLLLERRDWERLLEFADASSARMKAARAVAETESAAIPIVVDPTLDDSSPTLVRSTPSEPPKGRRRSTLPPQSAPVGARVLLCDDDSDVRDVISAMLEAVGLKVEAVPSAEDALERMRAKAPDLLVLDWTLPGMTGIELCRLVRREPKLQTLPVLFLTGHASSKDVVEAFASGADDYVVKPFRAPELGARIFGLLRRTRSAHTSP
jgi:two-component system, OmpR family, phosphate regulon response regulator PhoB